MRECNFNNFADKKGVLGRSKGSKKSSTKIKNKQSKQNKHTVQSFTPQLELLLKQEICYKKLTLTPQLELCSVLNAKRE